jgi:hypothetical protein
VSGSMSIEFIKKQTIWLFVIFIFLGAWLLQATMLLNVDVSWLLEASRRMLNGGTYTNDLFENNPPWILYFYVPPVLFSKVFSVSTIYSIRLYIFFLSAMSLGIIYYLFQKVFLKQDAGIARLLFITLAIMFVMMPQYDLGQREHLLFILSLPYFLMMSLRLQGEPFNKYFAFSMGLLAASVFIMKPFFLAVLCFIEIYYLLKKKSCWAWLRPEIFALLLLLGVYLAILTLRHPDYLQLVMPFALHWCYLGTKKPWVMVFFNHQTVYCLYAVLFCVASFEINRYKSLTIVLLLGLAGFFVSYLVQQEDWPYHLLPAYYLAMFLCVLVFSAYVTLPDKKNYVSILMIFFSYLMLMYLRPYNYLLAYHFILQPANFFLYEATVFMVVLSLMPEKLLSPSSIFSVLISIIIGYVFYYGLSSMVIWNKLYFPATCCVTLLSFSLLIPGSIKHKVSYLLMNSLGTLIFILPFYESLVMHEYYNKTKSYYEKLISYINQNAAQQSVYFFTTNIEHAFPNIIYTHNTTSASRFSFFWALPGLVKQSYLRMDEKRRAQQTADRKFFIEMTSKDLNLKKPKFLFIDDLDKKNSLFFFTKKDSSYALPNYFKFDYLSYFRTNENFNEAWKNYRYTTSLSANYLTKINPLAYQLQLTYKTKPRDSMIEAAKLYLYVSDHGNLELALKYNYNQVTRLSIPMHGSDFNNQQLLAIKQKVLTPGSQLDIKNKDAILNWLSKQEFNYPFYKFNVYERI